MRVYLAPKPGNFDDFDKAIYDIVNFSMLKPENLVKLIDEDFTIDKLVYGMNLNGEGESESILSGLQFYIFILLIVTV